MREMGIFEAVLTGFADRTEHREEILDFSKYPAEPNWDAYNRHMDSIIQESTRKLAEQVKQQAIDFIRKKKEGLTMQVFYNGFTGDLVKLERKVIDPESLYIDSIPIEFSDSYELQIFTPDNGGIVAFTGVKLKDIKICGGVVAFDA